MNNTRQNLEKALYGEARASIRYQAFAKKADQENFAGVARLFRAAAMAENVHAHSHQRVLATDEQAIADLKSQQKTADAIAQLESEGEVKTTIENLKNAAEGETFEFTKMYPPMIKDAVAEKQQDARHSFEYSMTVEMAHARLFKKALAYPAAVATETYHICPLCGHTAPDKPPGKCPYCGVDAGKFIAVD